MTAPIASRTAARTGSGGEVLRRAAALSSAGQPYALATVTWRRGPSSGKGGCRAIVHPDGTVEGWLGGACEGCGRAIASCKAGLARTTPSSSGCNLRGREANENVSETAETGHVQDNVGRCPQGWPGHDRQWLSR